MSKKIITFSTLAAAIILSVGFMLFGGGNVTCAQTTQGCSPLDPVNKGWAKNSTVYYDVSSLPAGKIRDNVVEAFTKWNTANASNGSGVSFQPSSTQHPATFTVAVGNASGYPAETTITATGGTVVNASTQINTTNTNAFNPNVDNYSDAILGAMLHEIGHTMGLDDMPVPDLTLPCGGQTAGQSVMNGLCGVNDTGENLPTNVKECDNNSVRNNSQYQTPTPTPTPTPGGGGCFAAEGCDCPCGDCINGCEPPEPTCDWYYPDLECSTVCEIDDYGYPYNCETECYQPPPVYICY